MFDKLVQTNIQLLSRNTKEGHFYISLYMQLSPEISPSVHRPCPLTSPPSRESEYCWSHCCQTRRDWAQSCAGDEGHHGWAGWNDYRGRTCPPPDPRDPGNWRRWGHRRPRGSQGSSPFPPSWGGGGGPNCEGGKEGSVRACVSEARIIKLTMK